MHKYVRNLLTEWRKLGLPFDGETFVVAVSGGADSVSLALALDDLKKETLVQDKIAGTQIEIAYDPARCSAQIIDKQSGQAVAYAMAYWFAWQAFYPKTELFRG